MQTLVTLLHIFVWYGMAVLTLAVILASVGMMATGSLRAVSNWLKQITMDHIIRGLICLPFILLITLAVATSRNNGEIPAWFGPPAISSLWGEDAPKAPDRPDSVESYMESYRER